MGGAKRWFSEALWDYGTVLILYRAGDWNAACFYAQQAAGKAVKALLYSMSEASFGHSMRLLSREVLRDHRLPG